MGLNKKQKEEWDSIVKKNKDAWAKDLYELIKKRRYWDVCFDRYSKYRIFCMHFEVQIKNIFKEAREKFPEMELSLEDVSHDLYLSVTEEDDFIEQMEDEINEVIKNLPKA